MAIGTVIHGEDAGGGSGMGWDGQVEFRGDLPITIGVPPVGSIYLVEKPTKVLGVTIYQSGLYMRDLDTGALSDWRRLNVKVTFQDNEFTLVKASDNSAKSRFDLSLVSASQTRVLTVQDTDGTIALLSNLNAHGLPTVLGIDNTTGANDIIITNPQLIKASTGNAFIKMWNGNDDNIRIATAPDSLLIPFSFIELLNNGFLLQTGNFNQGTHYVNRNQVLGVNVAQVETSIFKNPFSTWGRYGMQQNDSGAYNTFNFPSYPFYASAQNATIAQLIVNAVVLGGSGQNLTKSNTVGVPDLQIQDGKIIHPETGASVIDLRFLGIDDYIVIHNDPLFAKSWEEFFTTYKSIGFNTNQIVLSDVGGKTIQLNNNYNNNTDRGILTVNEAQIFFQLYNASNTIIGNIGLVNNSAGDIIAGNNAPDNFPAYASVDKVTFKQGIYNSFAGGGAGTIVKTANASYCQQMIWNWNDQAFETKVVATVPTADRTQTLQDADGIIALKSDIANAVLKQKAGRVLNAGFSGNPKKSAAIVFATAYPNADYSVQVTPNTQNNTTFSVDIESKTATGFVINAHANNINDLIDVTWFTSEFGEN